MEYGTESFNIEAPVPAKFPPLIGRIDSIQLLVKIDEH